MHPVRHPRVILRNCQGYERETIRGIVRDGLRTLGLKPRGKTLVKPNAVAAGPLFQHAHTRSEFLHGVIQALQDEAGDDLEEIALGERSGITVPTRYAFDEAKYAQVLKHTHTKAYYFEESPQVEIPLSHSNRLRDFIYTPAPIAQADFFVNCPKFKAHPWTTVTFSMKNYIGIQDDRHRLIDHDFALNRKVADLQHVIQPQLVAIDAIIAGEGRMLTPSPRELNLVILGNNQVAVDAVCCHLIGIDPREVDHIRMAHEDGFGPIELENIEVLGDVSLAEAKERAHGFEVGLVPVDKYFEGTKISAYAGASPAQSARESYCWGGCPGALEEAIEVLRLFDERCDQLLPRLHFVFGKYDGPLDIQYGEKVVFVGDCTEWSGQVGQAPLRIKSLYRNRSTKDPHTISDEDLYAKLLRVRGLLKAARHQPHLRLEGCPVSVAELILVLAELGKTKNPYFEPRQVLRFNHAYLAWRITTLAQRAVGKPYQIQGTAVRGAAKPELGS